MSTPAPVTALCVGEALIDFVAASGPGDLADVTIFHRAAGGAPANVAVGLARLGIASGFVGRVGDDAFGRHLRDTLADAGVDVSAMRATPGLRTGLAFISHDHTGERHFAFHREPGADTRLTPADIDAAPIMGCRALYFSSLGLVGEPSRSALRHAIARARAAGALVAFDPNLRQDLWPDTAAATAGLRDGMAAATLIKISEEEVRFLVPDGPLETAARRLWHDGLEAMLVTRGRQGCLGLTADRSVAVPGLKVEAVDATGAGDGFMAGFLAERLRAGPAALSADGLAAALRFATATGALTTTCPGVIPALPTRRAVEDLLSRPTG